MSVGTSKLHHYAYPFLPPVALAWWVRSGLAGADGRRLLERAHWCRSSRWLTATGELEPVSCGRCSWSWRSRRRCWRWRRSSRAPCSGRSGAPRSCATRTSRGRWSSRCILATLAGRGVMAARVLLPAAVLMLVLPMNGYEDVLRRARAGRASAPVGADCLVRRAPRPELAAGRPRPASMRSASSAGSCTRTSTICITSAAGSGPRSLDTAALNAALFTPGRQRPVLIDEPITASSSATHEAALRDVPALPLRDVLLLMPGPYAVCGAERHDPRAPPLADAVMTSAVTSRLSFRHSTRRRASARRWSSSAAFLAHAAVGLGSPGRRRRVRPTGRRRSWPSTRAREPRIVLQREPHRGKGGAVKAGLLAAHCAVSVHLRRRSVDAGRASCRGSCRPCSPTSTSRSAAARGTARAASASRSCGTSRAASSISLCSA